MCGIVGATTTRQITKLLLDGLTRLEYRGYDSAGIVIQDKKSGKFNRVRQTGKVRDLRECIKGQSLKGQAGLAHTRWATHGIPSDRNAHPHIVNDRLALVHNGIIENFAGLRAQLEANGRKFSSETDTEVLLNLIESEFDSSDHLVEAVRTSMQQVEGAFAIGLMAKDQPGTIIAAKRDCPLVVGLGEGENFIASDVLAIRAVTNRFLFLEDDEIVVCTSQGVTLYDHKGEQVHRPFEVIKAPNDEVDKRPYRHFMEKEIYAQPECIRDTLEGRITAHDVVEQTFGLQTLDALRETKSITIVGCGTSYYAAKVARYWIEDMAGIPCHAEIASEFRYRNAAVPEKSLFLSLSQSGESADTIAAARLAAKEPNYTHTMNIGNVTTSTLMRESHSSLAMRAGIEVSVASTKCFTTVLTDLLLLSLLLARSRGWTPKQEREVVEALHELPDEVENALKLSKQTYDWAVQIHDKRNVLFLGRGAHYPIAMEGALKLKEISYTHAEGYPAGELKHGPLALVDRKMPVIAIAPSNDLIRKVQSNLQEVKARGGKLYVFTDQDAGFADTEDVEIIEVPKVHPLLSPIVYTIPLQLLAYHVAVLKGTDVDQPRNIAKSVTVE